MKIYCSFLISFAIICASALFVYSLPPLLRETHLDLFASSAKIQDPVTGNSSTYRVANITINGFNLMADVPTTSEQFQKGLDIKDHIKENQGMLFIFKEPGKQPFWMHGMKFPIDIIWLDNKGKVVHIERNLSPCIIDLVCPTYSPDRDSVYVLETTAGFTERHNVDIGTHMYYHLIG